MVATTSPRHRSVAQLLVLSVTAASAVAVGVGVVGLVAGSDAVSSTLFVTLGSLLVLGGLAGLPRLRRAERHELRIGVDGLTVVSRRGRQQWSWADLRGVSVSAGVERYLFLEDDRADRLREQAPRLDAVNRLGGLGSPVSVRVPLGGMQPEERVILEAIRSCSGGRFPDPELRPGRRGPRDP